MTNWTQEDIDRLNAKRGASLPAHIPAKKERAKFGNKKTLCDGILFDSGDEADRYSELVLLLKSGEIRDLELQPQYGIFACELTTGRGIQVASFKADFRYFDIKAARQRIEDVKSDATKGETAYRLRKKLVECCHGIVIEEISV